MRRGRIFLYLSLIVIVVVVVIVLAMVSLGGVGGPQAEPTPAMVEIFVAAQNIPQGQPITAEALTTWQMPPDKVNAVMFRSDQIEDVVGKLARYPIDQGVVITSSLIGDATPEAAGPAWANLIPPGMVAQAVPASRLNMAAYGVQDGAHVNISTCLLIVDVDTAYQSLLPNLSLAVTGTGFAGQNELPSVAADAENITDFTTFPYYSIGGPQGRVELDASLQQPFYIVPQEYQRPRMVCQIVLQDVMVLRAGDFELPEAAAAPITTDLTETTPPPADTSVTVSKQIPDIVTLVVNPADSLALTYLVFNNSPLVLTLRNPNDQSRIQTESMTLAFLLNQYYFSVPAKLPYALNPRLDQVLTPTMPNDVIVVTGQ